MPSIPFITPLFQFIKNEAQGKRKKPFLSPLFGILLVLSQFTPRAAVSAFSMAAPTPISPQNNTLITATGYTESGYSAVIAAPPLAIPEFSWSAVEGAKSYRFQVSQNIAFSTIAFETTTPNTQYTPTSAGPFPDGNLYWRVRVDNPAPSSYSEPVLIVKKWATQDNSPALTSPANDVSLSFYGSTDFSWSAVPGAARYRFEIASSQNGFSTAIYKQVTLATTIQPPAKLANGEYFWRVVPLDPNDREGIPSETRSFSLTYGSSSYPSGEIPELLEPGDHTEPTFTPTFRWTAVRGAQFYKLQYTSDPTCNFGNAGLTKTVDTRSTSYTPTDALPNDVNYCWHVLAQSGSSVSGWSPTFEFIKKWYIQAVPLTPVNNYQYVKNPIFSWSPVPLAANYKLEVCEVNSFPCPPGSIGYYAFTVNTFHIRHEWSWSQRPKWYWRVTPYDRNNNAGKPSDGFPNPRPAAFNHTYASIAPHLIYPLYYYAPNNFPNPDLDVEMQPYEDRSVPFPIFMWHRVINLTGQDAAGAYQVQVDNDPLFGSIDWDFKTENLSAAPTNANPFSPQPNTPYYWRVCNLHSLEESCPGSSSWSQKWITQFDPSKALAAKPQMTLLRPANAAETVETMPLFEWWPLQGANGYQIQISQDPSFSSSSIDTQVPYPAFSPQNSPGQRSLNHLGYGTYYWRVRGLSNGSPVGAWSESWRFQLAAQTQWRENRTLGIAENQLLAASDPDDISNDSYELTGLHVTQDKDYWYFGFLANAGENMAYGLYLDLDQTEASGAGSDPRGNSVSTISIHRPEYAIYINKQSNTIPDESIAIYRWTGSEWSNNPQTLEEVGGSFIYSGGYLEFRVPNTAIGMAEDTSSATISLFSVNESTHTVQDAVPSSTSLTVLDRFTTVSERINLAMPPGNVTGDSTTFPSVLPFFFNYPSNTPWEGFNIQVSVDSRFTTWLRDYLLINAPLIAPQFSVEHTRVQDVQGDNTYYWRVRPVYYTNGNILGAWSQPWRFERNGFVPVLPEEPDPRAVPAYVNYTPTFAWEHVEGAAYYEIEVDNDPNFAKPEVDKSTTQNTYTPDTSLTPGTYYWRVRIRRDSLGEGSNDWSEVKSFTLGLPTPTNLTPNNSNPQLATRHAPTMCWDPLLLNIDGTPVLAAYKYRVQVSRDPNFSSIYDNVDTEQACWSPTKGYDDGTFYWHVAMIDGSDRLSAFSPPAVFTKQYKITSLVNPANQAQVSGTPTFVWTAVEGASTYKLEVSQNPTFSPAYESITTTNTRYTPTKTYDAGKTYYWRVAMIDKDGKVGPFNNATILSGTAPGGGGSNKIHIFIPLGIKP